MHFFISGCRRLRRLVSEFSRDEDGAIVAYVLLMFLMMVVAAGMAVDFTRQESARADLQNALDRGTLAAADFSQTVSDKQLVVRDYMRSSAIHSPDLALNVVETSGVNFSRVTADARYQIPTFFLKIIGINTLTVAAQGAAEQQKRKVEISMILDVSGSMGWSAGHSSGSKLDVLKVAAHEFIDTLITTDTMADTSISIVPYSENVRPSANLAAQFNLNTHHNYHYCFAFDHGALNDPTDLGDFSSMGISRATQYQQAQRIKSGWGSRYRCPRAGNEILPMSNSVSALHNRIASLRTEGYTATYDGLKWGAALLDPDNNPVVQGLVGAGDVDAGFSDRPLAYDTTGAMKIIVIMTDGANTRQYRIRPSVYANRSPDYWNSNAPRSRYLERLVDNDIGAKGDRLMHTICDAAKARNIVIYTIGFELSSDPAAAAALSQCASATDNHFLVEGVQISSAFQTIAANIQKLRLVQ
ncbi:MAG: pilus assembly protein TadG-related protein [Paracoccaceae bacterium]